MTHFGSPSTPRGHPLPPQGPTYAFYSFSKPNFRFENILANTPVLIHYILTFSEVRFNLHYTISIA